MDEHEKNMKDIHIVTHDDVDKAQESISENIPHDLVLEILSRLPAKSILRFMCVSKLWYSFTKLPSFINSFSFRSSKRPPNLLIQSKDSILSFPQHHDKDMSYSIAYNYKMTNHTSWEYPLSQSIHGLILVERFKIWNPSLRRVLTIPYPNENIESYKCCLLGYDPLEGKHKILCFLNEEYSEPPQILTLGAQESWRKIIKSSPTHFPTGRFVQYFNGILYYDARLFGVDGVKIMCFDVKSETFNPIEFPNNYVYSFQISRIIPYEGRLALVDTSNFFHCVDLYILKDANGDKWTNLRFLHLPFNTGPKILLDCKGITDDGELIFVSYFYPGSLSFQYLDPKKNSVRETLMEGIFNDDEFPHGIGIYLFLNHIESLVSF